MKRITFLIALLAIITCGSSQEPLIGFMPTLPQVQQQNPALYRAEKAYFSLPLLSSLDITLATTGVSLHQLAEKDLFEEYKAAYAWDELAGYLKPDNKIIAQTKVPLLGLGFRLKKGFFSLDLTQRSFVRASVPGDISKLRYLQNDIPISSEQSFNVNNFGIKAVSYNEYRFAYAFDLNDKLRIGAAFKYLSGVGYVDGDKLSVSMDYEQQRGGSVTLNGHAYTAGPFVYENSPDASIDDIDTQENLSVNNLLFSKNNGFGFDFGAKYQATPALTISVAINDIGRIKWKDGTATFSADKQITIDEYDAQYGLDMYEFLNDSIIGSLSLREEGTTVKMKLATNYNVQAEYQLCRWLKAGASYHHINQYGNNINTYTISGGLAGKSYSSLMVSYSWSDYYDSMIGLGLTTRLGAFQPYLLVNSVNGLFNSRSASAVSYTGGINFVFGRKKHKDTTPEIITP